ncbi:type I methionyl aminopeptidase [Candidatus Peregrinibacteria bacterium]|nr:type I methionyl aminopeptidase [Candidatus Peregrinibacteria bacterium]
MKYITVNGSRISIKNPEELEFMREGGKILGLILHEVEKMIEPGITTRQIDNLVEKLMQQHQVKAGFKGYHGFPASICASVNDEVVHGIPSDRILNEGDIITIDCGVLHKGLNTDSAITVPVGRVSKQAKSLIKTAKNALEGAIAIARPGVRITDLSHVIQATIEKAGFHVVKELTGHGIGQHLHEDPIITNFVDYDPGPVLEPGMTIAIEPILSAGDHNIKLLKDKWTYVTADGSLSSQQEHTIAITEKGAEILTKRPNN